MKEIDKLFQIREIKEIQKLLTELIKKINSTDKTRQEKLLKEITSKAKKRD